MRRSQGLVWGMTLALGGLGVLTWARSSVKPAPFPHQRGISQSIPSVSGPTGENTTSPENLQSLLPQAPEFSARSLADLEAQGAQKDGATVWWIPFVVRAVNFHHLYPSHRGGLRSGSGKLK